jgi:hypothetical protein
MNRSDYPGGAPHAYTVAEGSAWLSSARAPLSRALVLSEMLDHGGELAPRIADALAELDRLERLLRENGLGRREALHP